MTAGESAYDVARRQREKAARLERSAELWERGAHGEVEVARVLANLPDGWAVMHDLAWPGRPRANIDHVVIGPGGVFVVDAKNWSGRVEVRDQVLTQNGRRREQAVVSTAEAAIALQGMVSPPTLCMGVLCFVRDDLVTGWARDVMVCSTANLVAMLTSRPHVLSPDDVRRCVDAVRRSFAERASSPSPQRRGVPRTAGPNRRAARRRPNRSLARLALTLVLGILLLAVVMGGGLQRASDWMGERLVEQMSPADPSPSEPPASPRKQLKKTKQGQRETR